MSFETLNLIEPIQKALITEGYTKPTPIQKQAIPIILDRKDLIGCAQTGTGKTAAFAIPILQILYQNKETERGKKKIKALIVTPTRELAIQIGESFEAYGKHTHLQYAVVFGGVTQSRQTNILQKGVDILVATPGRLLDLMNQGFISLKNINLFVLDEADRMLDMGFIHDVKRIIADLPKNRQSLFFSATMPPTIVKLAASILNNPVKVEIVPDIVTADAIQQSIYFVDNANKTDLLYHILNEKSIVTALVFTRTKHGADKVCRYLNKKGVKAEAIHGNKSQNARQSALLNFKNQSTRVLVATDIAARGLDIDELSCVINYEIPNIAETYVHRIGRTGRAGAKGIALSFCDAGEKAYLKDIQFLISKVIPVVDNHPYPMTGTEADSKAANKRQRGDYRGNGQRNSGQKSKESKSAPAKKKQWYRKDK